jgi:hypothetical protein
MRDVVGYQVEEQAAEAFDDFLHRIVREFRGCRTIAQVRKLLSEIEELFSPDADQLVDEIEYALAQADAAVLRELKRARTDGPGTQARPLTNGA